MTFKPMRAAGPDPKKPPAHFWKSVQYPLSVSPKLDGIRGCSHHGKVTSRKGEPLPSLQVQDELSGLEWVDCEIIEGNPTDYGVYNRTQSHVMSVNKPGDLSYHVFDYIHPDWLNKPYVERLEMAFHVTNAAAANSEDGTFFFVEHQEVDDEEELLIYERARLDEGWEGVIGYNPMGRYKQGKCTLNEALSWKFKRFTDLESRIVGFYEQMINTNPQTRDALGYAKRSKAKEGLIPANTLGGFIVDYNGVEVRVGPGVFKEHELKEIWDHREQYLGRLLKWKMFGHGIKELPRFGQALGFRSEIDL